MENNELPRTVDIVKKLTNSDIVKETHISYAIISDKYVYKIKKPVDFGFLDYKLPKSRRTFCLLEKELNDRFSDDIYLEVMKIVNRGGGKFELVNVENSVPAIEYVLKMKRIDDKDFLNNRIQNKLIHNIDMSAIGAQIANLLISLDNAPLDDDFSSLSDIVKFNAVENFNQTEKYTNTFIDETLFNYIQKSTLSFLQDNQTLINSRFENGFYKNGHGDLRLEHIYFGDSDKIGLIDCIEFNKRFRYNDIIAEAAFLSMEMDFEGYVKLSDAFIKGFLQVVNDSDSLKLLNYYRCYYAYVRAKVTCFLLDSKTPDWELYEQKQSEVTKLINMSATYAYAMSGGKNAIFYGLMGTGKSRNATTFSKCYPFFYISSDVVRKTMTGLKPTDRKYVQWGSDIYSKEHSLELYKKLGDIVNNKNKIGRICVADASFTQKEYLELFTKYCKCEPFKVMLTAPEEVIMQRLNARLSKSKIIADGRPEIYDSQKNSATLPEADATVCSTSEPIDNATTIFKKLIQ